MFVLSFYKLSVLGLWVIEYLNAVLYLAALARHRPFALWLRLGLLHGQSRAVVELPWRWADENQGAQEAER